MDALWLKLILIFIMFLMSTVFGLLPIRVLNFLRKRAASSDTARSKWPSTMLCWLSCFTGGVFLGTCFLHLLPDVGDGMTKVREQFKWHVHYPVGEMISCLGFFLVFFVEELVLLIFGHKHHHSHEHGDSHSFPHGCTDDGHHHHDHNPNRNGHKRDEDKILMQKKAGLNDRNRCQIDKEKVQQNGTGASRLTGKTAEEKLLMTKTYGSYDSLADRKDDVAIDNCQGLEMSTTKAEPECCEGPCEGRDEAPPILMAYRPHAHSHGVRSVTLVLALSFHSIIEGLALGVQGSFDSALKLFLAVIVHKCIVLFSTGVQLARTHAHRLRFVFVGIVLLALMSPLGAVLGIAVEQSSLHTKWKDFTVMVLEGLSVGTFLYVTFFEVLVHERDNEHNNMIKLLATFVGFAFIAGLSTLGHDHHRDDEASALNSSLINESSVGSDYHSAN